ncbi:MAG TPA: DUF2480 family protein [Puia sp.]|jgi:hypothetical protein|nr:DUF2480 family protein [Puia sp.]
MSEEIINRVAQSGLLTLDLEDFYPREEIAVFDLKPLLFREMILKEKEFRAGLQEIDWSGYTGKILAVTCTADAIIPAWAYMLVAVHARPYARSIILGDRQAALQQTFLANLQTIDLEAFADKRVVVKGCGDLAVGPFAYLEITRLLQPVVKSILYGEACSNVPVYKKK